MKVTTVVGKYNVISSGMIISDDYASDITLRIDDEAGTVVDVVFKFIENENGEFNFEMQIHNNEVALMCTNFKDTMGTIRPIDIGSISGKEMYVLFRHYCTKEKYRKIEYTLLSEK